MSEIARKHHYLPQFYLKGFTKEENKGKLFVFDKNICNQWLSLPKNIAYENDLYKMEKDEDISADEDSLEQSFAEFESMVAPIIKEMEERKIIPKGEDFILLINFIALIHCRLPSVNEQSIRPLLDNAKKQLEMVASNKDLYESIIKSEGIECKYNYDEMKEFLTSDRYAVEAEQNSKMKMLIDQIDKAIPLLLGRKWSLLLCDDDLGGFICSDNPVVQISLFELPSCISRELEIRCTEITIPLSKNMAMIGKIDFEEEYGFIKPRLLAEINKRTLNNSVRFLYSSSKDFIFNDENDSICNKGKLISYLKEESCNNTKMY